MGIDATLGIGELSRRAGIRPSAIRYYEEIGLLGKAPRSGGKRRYTEGVVSRLAFISVARRLGFTLEEIRSLIGGFPVARWKPLAQRKLAELATMSARIERMRGVLEESLRCSCVDVEACGEAMTMEPRVRPKRDQKNLDHNK
jgi:MerR family redox-sensitive transcriptional activator SoxR